MPNTDWTELPPDPLHADYRWRVDAAYGGRAWERRVGKGQDPWEPVTNAREILALEAKCESLA